MSDEKQDINSDFNHVKHVPMEKDQTHTHTYHCEVTDRIVLSFLQEKKKNIIFNNIRPFRTKEGVPRPPSRESALPFLSSKGSGQFLTLSTLQCSESTRLKMLWVIPATRFQASTPAPKPTLAEKAEG